MRWSKPNLKAIHSLWGQIARGEVATDTTTERVRRTMLEIVPRSPQHIQVFRIIHSAPNLQALWYARGALMVALAAEQNEAIARDQLESITRLFDGLLPESRRGRLARAASPGPH